MQKIWDRADSKMVSSSGHVSAGHIYTFNQSSRQESLGYLENQVPTQSTYTNPMRPVSNVVTEQTWTRDYEKLQALGRIASSSIPNSSSASFRD